MPGIRLDLDAFLLQVRREYRFILATFAASGIGYLGSAAAPVIVNALIEAGLDHKQVGDLGTIELLTLAVASVLITPYVPVVSHRKLAVGGTLTAVLGLVISALSASYTPMILGRIATGVGSGLAISGANAAVAAREDAERIFAIIWTMGGVITASLAMYLPGVVEARDTRSVSVSFCCSLSSVCRASSGSPTSLSRPRSQLLMALIRRLRRRRARVRISEGYSARSC
jgi:MFS family permease